MEKILFTGMTQEQKLTAIKTFFDSPEFKKGAYIKIAHTSLKKALKAYEKEFGETIIEKYSEGVVRLGIDYHHTATYRNKITSAEQTPSRTSPYDSPVSGYENFLVKTEKDGKVRYKLKVYVSKTKSKMRTKWFINGCETTESALDGIMQKQSKNNGDYIVYTIFLDNLISIGG